MRAVACQPAQALDRIRGASAATPAGRRRLQARLLLRAKLPPRTNAPRTARADRARPEPVGATRRARRDGARGAAELRPAAPAGGGGAGSGAAGAPVASRGPRQGEHLPAHLGERAAVARLPRFQRERARRQGRPGRLRRGVRRARARGAAVRRHLRRHGVGRRLCDRGAQALPLTVTVAVALTSRPRHGQVHPKIHVPYLLISDSAHAPLHSLPGAAALAAPASRVQHWCAACPTPSPNPKPWARG